MKYLIHLSIISQLLTISFQCIGQVYPKIDVDNKGSINLIGNFRDSLVFSNSQVIYSTLPFWAYYMSENFLIHMDSSGQVKWYKLFNEASFTDYDIVSDKTGNVFLAGQFYGVLPLDSVTSTSDSLGNIIVIKYDTAGNLIWFKQSYGFGNNYSFNIDADTSDNIYFTSLFNGQFTFGEIDTLSSTQTNTFIAKFDSSGNNLWLTQISGSAQWIFDIEVDDNGNSFVTGHFSEFQPVYFGNDSIISNGSFDAYIAKCNSDGTPLWIRKAGGSSSYDIGWDIGVSNKGNSTMIGGFMDTIYFQNVPPLVSTPNEINLFITNYNISGIENWAVKGAPNTPNPNTNHRVAMDANDNIYISGYFWGSPITINGIPVSGSGSYLIKIDSTGQVICSTDRTNSTGHDIDIDNSNNVYITGLFNNTLDIGTQTFQGANNNFYIAKFDQACNLIWTNIIKNQVTGIKEKLTNKNKVKVYPNPTPGLFTLKFSDVSILQGIIKILSITGNELFTKKIHKREESIDVSNYPKGIYLIEITINDSRIIEKIIKY